MAKDREIFSLVEEKEQEAAKTGRQGLIIQPGALGDCILTLPVARFLKQSLDLGTLAIMGNMDFLAAMLGRTCVDKIRSLEGAGVHRLFEARGQFNLGDKDPLLTTFMPYSWIISFLGEAGSDFEQNLLFAANCTHSAEVGSVRLKADEEYAGHISQFYMDEVCRELPHLEREEADLNAVLILAGHNDVVKAQMLLDKLGVDEGKFVLMAPGAGSVLKCWGNENFAACAKASLDAGFTPVFVIGPAEIDRKNINTEMLGMFGPVIECPSFSELVGLCSLCRCYLGNDSGLSHLAGAVGAQTVAVFGPTSARRYRPLGPKVTAIEMGAEGFGQVNPEQAGLVCAKMFEQLGN
ncbi:MAG: hypothetical protein A2Y07_00790 [Planctomycetes bacterium GWF2_50_10]|nr:MAG: hypothetical protein A2Y07_00790 [Planctomycetes bacterium GWF2_50_10]